MMKTFRLTTLTLLFAGCLTLPGYTQITNKGKKTDLLVEFVQGIAKAARNIVDTDRLREINSDREVRKMYSNAVQGVAQGTVQGITQDCQKAAERALQDAVENRIIDKEEIRNAISTECRQLP